MNLLDNHVHTHFSSDGKDTMQDIINEAIDKGMMYLTLTDHLEYNTSRFSLDCKDYLNTIEYYKEKHKMDISILKGIEIGYQKQLKNEIEEIVNTNNFDFVLCSTHAVDGINVPDKLYFENLTKEQSYHKYFESILDTVTNFKNFDVYGHLDYLVRYANYLDNKVVYNDFKDILDEVLKTMIHSGKGIELNTSGYRYGLDAIHPNKEIIKRYKELNGEIITLGSDSHRKEDLCRDFDICCDLLSDLGFEYVSYYKNRKPNFIKICKQLAYA